MRIARFPRKACLGALIALGSLVARAQAPAETPSALPDCRQYAKMDRKADAASLSLFVLIDQTTPFSPALRQAVADQIVPLLQPGTELAVYQFSAYIGGRFTEKILQARMNAPIEPAARSAIGKAQLERFDKCLVFQATEVRKLTGKALREAFGGSTEAISKSDVLASLRDVSDQVRQSTAGRKVVLLASDMLENSAVTSFYANNAVRKIDPAAELLRAESGKLIGDFGRADVFVIGAGLIAETPDRKNAYRDPKTMQQLQAFWREYFAKSQAQLVEFGMPALLGQVR